MSLIRFFNNDGKANASLPVKSTSLVKRFSRAIQPSEMQAEVINPDPHMLVSFLPDTSESMTAVTQQFNGCLSTAFKTLKRNPSVARRVDVQLVSAGGREKMELPFINLVNAEQKWLSAGGGTPLGAAAIRSLEGIREREHWLHSKEVSVNGKILVVISDGGANDPVNVIQNAKQSLREASKQNVSVIPLLTRGGDRELLEDFCGCRCFELADTDIEALFARLTDVIRTVSMMSPSQIEGPETITNLMFEGE